MAGAWTSGRADTVSVDGGGLYTFMTDVACILVDSHSTLAFGGDWQVAVHPRSDLTKVAIPWCLLRMEPARWNPGSFRVLQPYSGFPVVGRLQPCGSRRGGVWSRVWRWWGPRRLAGTLPDLGGRPSGWIPVLAWTCIPPTFYALVCQVDDDWVATLVSRAGLSPSLVTCRGGRVEAVVFSPGHAFWCETLMLILILGLLKDSVMLRI